MALRVWLPLNGTLDNIGVSGITMSGTPASWGNGKIGKCATFTGNVSQALASNTTHDLDYTDNFSWCMWINPNYTAGSTQYIFTVGRADGTTFGYGASVSSATVINIKFGSNGSSATNWNLAVNSNEWTHVAFTKKGSSIKIYKNGVLTVDSTFSGVLPEFTQSTGLGLGCFHYSNGNIYPFYGSLNDFRIYDHCLSPKEVKEISQGLILHYKLNGWSGGVGENLATNTTFPLNSIEGYQGAKAVEYNHSDWTSGGRLFSSYTTSRLTFTEVEANQPYTISAWVYIYDDIAVSNPGGTTIFYRIYKTGDSPTYSYDIGVSLNGVTERNKWVRISNTFTAPATYTYNQGGTFQIGGYNGHFLVSMPKIEKGSTATAYIQAPADLGIDTTKITDSSGYEHDGTILSNPYTNSDADRYQISTYFDGVDDGILIENLTLSSIINDKITYSFWIKPNGENGARSVYFGSYSSTSWSIEKTTGNLLRLYWDGSPDETCTGATITDGVWQHIAIAKNGINDIKVYINGEQKWTSTTTHNALTFPTTYRIGRDTRSGDNTPYKGQMSDFRIYATALSAEDILDLYHTPASIDNLGGLHGFEMVEDDGNSISKNGLIHNGNISQFLEMAYLKYDPNLYFEPDGSVWVHIYHHNHPDLASFASTDTFATSVKKDSNRWFNATEICNQLDKWEFLIKYCYTESGTVYKERWIQTKNPENAVFGDVDAADITRITGNGYKTGGWGGLYKKNASAYWVMNNGNSGNWWGATGSFSIYQGGIPGYGGTVTTTGYNDLYVRIDNIDFNNLINAKIKENNLYLANNFIEK